MRWLGLLALAGCDLVLGLAPPIRRDASVDTHAPNDGASDGASDAGAPARSCSEALSRGVTTDGVVTIDPDGPGSGAAFDVYCDMTTAGGGWMLVWSYGFNNYQGFTNSNNAVTPRPSWNYPSGNGTPQSTTTPTSPATPGAMPFAQWSSFGSELLVTSTINHWIQCSPGTGSLVTLTQGSLTCQVVKAVPNKCTTVAPNVLVLFGSGPGLTVGGGTNNYYFFDGSVTGFWPTHDPCGTNSANQLTGVANPGGAVYVR